MHKRKARRASILAILLMVTTLMLMLAAVVGQNALTNMGSTHSSVDRTVARYAAFAGMQRGLAHLVANSTYEGTIANGTLPSQPDMLFTVSVDNGANGIDNTITPAGIALGNDSAYITATATYKNGTVVRTLSGMDGMAVRDVPRFDQAILAGSNAALNGDSKTRQYDFTVYKNSFRDSQSTNTSEGYIDPAGNSTGRGAQVRTNGMLQVEGTSKIEGDIIVPLQTTSANVIGGILPTVTDWTTSLVKGVDYTGAMNRQAEKFISKATPPYDPALAVVNVTDTPADSTTSTTDPVTKVVTTTSNWHHFKEGAYKSFNVASGQEAFLDAGTYYFDDELSVAGKLHMNGEVIIYVGKKMMVTGEVNYDGEPQKCQVYFTDADNTTLPTEPPPTVPAANITVSRLYIQGGGRATIVAAGQHLRTYLDGGRLLGAVVSDVVNMTNSSVEFDKNLIGRTYAMDAAWKLTGVHERGQ